MARRRDGPAYDWPLHGGLPQPWLGAGGHRPDPQRTLHFGVVRRLRRATFGEALGSLPGIEA